MGRAAMPHDPNPGAECGPRPWPASSPAPSPITRPAVPPSTPGDAARAAPVAAATDAAAARGEGLRGAAVSARLAALDDALRAAAARVYAGDATPDPALHAAVCSAVDALRADGADILTTLRAVKERLAGVGPPGVCDAAVRWCIARYYDPSERVTPAPPP